MTYKFTTSDETPKRNVLIEHNDGSIEGFDEGTERWNRMVEDGITPNAYVAPAETMASIRAKRNQLLRDTDWQGMSDVTMSDAQTAYRKKLRDLPATNADPTKIVFPDAP